MIQKILTAAILLFAASANAQYKNDNILFKTVDPTDLCAALENNKGYLLLDVRSPGEHYDTSQFAGLNIGHLKGAKNISVNDLGKRLSELQAYKDKPVFVYCSHSQRSRRASKMLADSGFSKVFNINGGLTAFYYTNAREEGCLTSMVETANTYNVISAIDLCNKFSARANNVFVLDVRPDSAFRHISTSAKTNAMGIIRNSVNIPLAELETKLSVIPKDKDIVVTELGSGDAARAAVILKNNGYATVSVMIEGIGRLLSTDEHYLPCKTLWYQPAANFNIISVAEFGRLAKQHNDLVLVDARTTEEFGNTAKDSWRNIGHLRNAINIPAAVIDIRIAELEKYKDRQIVVYGFSGDNESYDAANLLSQHGFKKVSVMATGLFDIRWSAANKKGMSDLKDMVVDVPEVNW